MCRILVIWDEMIEKWDEIFICFCSVLGVEWVILVKKLKGEINCIYLSINC